MRSLVLAYLFVAGDPLPPLSPSMHSHSFTRWLATESVGLGRTNKCLSTAGHLGFTWLAVAWKPEGGIENHHKAHSEPQIELNQLLSTDDGHHRIQRTDNGQAQNGESSGVATTTDVEGRECDGSDTSGSLLWTKWTEIQSNVPQVNNK